MPAGDPLERGVPVTLLDGRLEVVERQDWLMHHTAGTREPDKLVDTVLAGGVDGVTELQLKR